MSRAHARRAVITAACAMLVGLSASQVRASTYDIFGYSARDVAMGGAMTAAVRGFSSIYYNPAALTVMGQQHVGLGLTLTAPQLFVDRPQEDPTRATVFPSTHVGLNLGWQYPLGGVVEQKLALAVALNIPANRLVRVQGIDPQTPQFYLYQNLQDKLLINLSAAWEPVEWLSVGLGVQILADLVGDVQLDLDILSGSFERREVGVTLEPTAALNAGVLVRPSPNLSLGVTFRGSNNLTFDLPVVVTEGDALGLRIDVAQTVLWTPHQLAFGASYTFEDLDLTVAADVTLSLWSAAPDPSPRLSVDVTGRLLDAFGLGSALDLSTRSEPLDLGFRDTVTPRLGIEWEPLDIFVLRGGYAFRPTPAPRQTGVTAYLDNDAHLLSLGVGFALKSPIDDLRRSILQLDLALSLTLLETRSVRRADPLDPVGDLEHGGALWTVVTTVSHTF